MPETGDYILVYFLERQLSGKRFLRTRNEWPMHITLVPWFSVSDEQALIRSVQSLAKSTSPFDVPLGDIKGFGNNATVTVAADQSAVGKLHQTLLGLVRDTVHDMQWVNERYVAHVTHHDGQPVPQPGTVLPVHDFWLVRLRPENMCEITRRFTLGDEQ